MSISISSTIPATSADSHRSSFYYNNARNDDGSSILSDNGSGNGNNSSSFLDFDDGPSSNLASSPQQCPPTRNQLIRKSQKLTRVFGQPPHPDAMSNIYHRRHSISLTSLSLDDRSFIDIDEPPVHTPSAVSVYENMGPEERVDADKTRMRLKLARLHRFLGARVPIELVTGLDPDPFVDTSPSPPNSLVPSRPPFWVKRRRSSSAAAAPVSWSESCPLDTLTDEEKARNVKRAIKLEQKFGVAPPQALYYSGATSLPPLPTTKAKPRPSQPEPSTFVLRNRNQSAYRKSSFKAEARPGTSESTKRLLSGEAYEHFNQSLHSLGEMIDQDDRESLAELHQYLSEDESLTLQELAGSPSSASSPKSDRRRSLPPRAPIVLVASDASSIYSITPEVSPFELRRRKASKLLQFFGVDYTLLINSVLESIEKGVQAESSAGRLDPTQTEVLMQKVRDLRTRGESFSSAH